MSYLFLYLAAINVIAFAAMGIDKAKARAGKWRIAESTLFGFPALLCLQCAAVVYLILLWKQVL